MSTVIYLIRHAETVDEKGIRNTNETSQIITSPCLLKLTFNDKELVNLEQIV